MSKIIKRIAQNPVINSNFDFWQRGTSSTTGSGITGFAAAYLADRFVFFANSTTGTTASFTQSRQSMPNGGDSAFKIQPKYFWRLTNTTVGASLATDSYHFLGHRIESVTKVSAGIQTISFMARSSIAGQQVSLTAVQNFGSGGSPSASVATPGVMFALTSSWRRYSVQVNVPSIVGKTIGTDLNDNFMIGIHMQAGTTEAAFIGQSPFGFAGTGTIDIAQVQINEGALLDYQPTAPTLAQELALCQRYFERIGGVAGTQLGVGLSLSTTTAYCILSFKVTKRTAPHTVTYTTPTQFRYNNGTNNYISSAMATNITGADTMSFQLTTSGIVGGNVPGSFDTLTTAAINIDAEL